MLAMTSEALPDPGATPRTSVRRLPELAVHDREVLHSVLDAGLVAHAALVDDGQPYAVPVAYARDGERLLLHGSSGSRLFRALAAGAPACVTVTLLDGLVLARSVFESSMNYRSAMVLGRCAPVTGADKLTALQRLSEHLMPGRWSDARPPNTQELAATTVLALPLTECSVKVSAGGPDDPPEDLAWPVWAGVVPLEHHFGVPQPALDLHPARRPPSYLVRWSTGRS